jgi:hypothetical protein
MQTTIKETKICGAKARCLSLMTNQTKGGRYWNRSPPPREHRPTKKQNANQF